MRWILFVVMLALVGFGGQKAYVAMTNTEPTKMTCQAYFDSGSSASWLELSDCELMYAEAVQLESVRGKVDKGTFVPVRPAGSSAQAKVLLQVDTKKVEEQIMQRLAGAAIEETPDGKVTIRETINGLVRWGINLDSKTRDALEEGAGGAWSKDFIIIVDGEQPSVSDIPVGIAMVVGGPLVFFGGIMMGRKKAAPAAAA